MRTIHASFLLIVSLLAASLPAGCATSGHVAPRPARINHVVFVKLVDPADAPALIADCDATIRAMPMVKSYWAGMHIDTGRATVDADYDVGAYMGFDSTEDYTAYVVDPRHVDLVARWRDRMQWLRVYDVLDDTP